MSRKQCKNNIIYFAVAYVFCTFADMIRQIALTIMITMTAYTALAQTEAQADNLLLPVRYDRATVKRQFSLDADTTSLADRVMMQTYLTHPEAVTIDNGTRRDETQANSENDSKSVAAPITTQMPLAETAPVTVVVPEGEDEVAMFVAKPNFWKFSGDYSLQFMQNYISPNWYKSGNSNYSMLGAVKLQYNYNNKQRLKWDNMLEMKLGFQATEADTVNTFKTTEDLIRYTTQLSLQAHKKWYYAAQMIASTQFTRGLKNNDATIYSDFLSPFNLNLSLGMNYVVDVWNKRLTGNILLAPLSYKMTYVDRVDLATRFGLDEGKHVLNNVGSMINIGLTWKPLDNIKWETRFYTFSNYDYLQLEWENSISFQFNRYISTTLFLYPRFDSHEERITSTYWQLKEYLSVGFAYSM